MSGAGNRKLFWASWAIAALMAVVSLAGIVFRDVLYRDPEVWILSAWLGNDIVTLAVGVPLLVWALVASARGSRRGELVWYAMMGYTVYNYAYYLFGARINALFPVYVVLLVMPVAVLAVLLHRADVSAIAESFHARTPARVVAGYLGLTGVGLLVAWLAQWAGLVFGGVVPAIGEVPFKLIASLDLTFVVPLCLLSAVLLWRREAWGYIFGAIMGVKGATYTLVLTAGSIVGGMRGVEGSAAQVPIWGVWTLVGAAAVGLLLAGAGAQTQAVADASRTGP